MKILAVDDDPIILELLTQFVASFGKHALVTAGSGNEALDLLASDTKAGFDCFMLDIQMPGMDGMELARQIRAMPDHVETPIVMLTAMSEKRYIDGAFGAGATDYVTKPFDVPELQTRIEVIDRLVRNRKPKGTKVFVAETLRAQPDRDMENVELHAPISLHDVDNVIDQLLAEQFVSRVGDKNSSTFFAKPAADRSERSSDLSGGHSVCTQHLGSGGANEDL